jgi:hypothetical protein
MNELLDFNAVLQDFQYKPNFGVKAIKQNDEWWVRIVMIVEDSRKPFRPWTVEQRPRDEYFNYHDLAYRPPLLNSVGYSPSREVTEVVGNYVIPTFVHNEELIFIEWLVQCVRMLEDHETFEWLRYKGELINDPHKEK